MMRRRAWASRRRSGRRGSVRGRCCLAVLLSGLAMMATGASRAQQPLSPAPPGSTDVQARQSALRDLQSGIEASEAERRKIEGDLEMIRADRVRLNAALIETATKVREGEEKVTAVEQRLDTLTGSEEAIHTALDSRRGTIVEVLAALQRMGRKPLPAILVRPEDMLKAIRTSMLLGAVVPELRGEVEALASDLADLAKVRASIIADRDTLSRETASLKGEQDRLNGLVAARQQAQTEAERRLGTEQERAAGLARQAVDLKDLIARMQAEADRIANDPRRKAAEADAAAVQARVAAGAFKDAARLAPGTVFTDAKGLLPLPASGSILKRFGSKDGFGSTEHGLSIATRSQAVVSAPSDGWVSFSGPYRTYGQLLILNAGSGYYIVLAGMDHATVALGQFVLVGEPIGVMGDGSAKTAASIALGGTQPVLYVEFRKDGAAIDPSPWWAKAELEKVRG